MNVTAMRAPRFRLSFKLGFALMRDRRVPLRAKGLALLLGLALTGLLEVFEIPMEGLISMLVPLVGMAGDMALDGVELVAGPLLLGNLLLPYLAPREVVAQVQAEQAGGGKGRTVDV
jgi:hypothetical protein